MGKAFHSESSSKAREEKLPVHYSQTDNLILLQLGKRQYILTNQTLSITHPF